MLSFPLDVVGADMVCAGVVDERFDSFAEQYFNVFVAE
jgi:hypothetical protein